MQCTSCQFENMPGSASCARCGASLTLARAAIAVHPPRAWRWAKWIPGRWFLHRLRCQVRNGISAVLDPVAARVTELHLDRETVLRALVPGWPQYHRGEPTRGRWFLFSYLAALFCGLLTAGTVPGSIFLGLAFSAHAVSIADAIITRFMSLRDRLAFTVLCGLILLVAIYWPVGRAASILATPIRLLGPMPPFHQGEVLWYTRIGTPSVGDLVLYDVPTVNVAYRTPRRQAARLVVRGRRVNRMVALEGQTIRWDGQSLWVDGQPSPWQPTGPIGLTVGDPIRVPDGHVLIPADNVAAMVVRSDRLARAWRYASLVPTRQVAGRVFLRTWPLYRLARVR